MDCFLFFLGGLCIVMYTQGHSHVIYKIKDSKKERLSFLFVTPPSRHRESTTLT